MSSSLRSVFNQVASLVEAAALVRRRESTLGYVIFFFYIHIIGSEDIKYCAVGTSAYK
jgi:hypothetical protein